MNTIKYSVVFLVTLGISLSTNAEQVYEKVNKQSTIEISDQPSQGTHEVEVTPNDVHQTPTSSEVTPENQPVAPRTTVIGTKQRETKVDDGQDYRDDTYIYPVPRGVGVREVRKDRAQKRHELKRH